MHASIWHVVENLDSRNGYAVLHREDHGLHRPFERRELADAGGDRFRHAVEPQLISVMMPSVPSAPTNNAVRS
jgi:hypothetical protein